MQRPKWRHMGVLVGLALLSSTVLADIRVGVTVSATGPQVSLGQPEKNATTLWPSEIGDEKVGMIVLDDMPDTMRAVTNTHKLMSKSNVDVIVDSPTTPNTLAMIGAAAEGKASVISLTSSARLIEPMNAERHWIFKTSHSDLRMAPLITEHATAHGVKIVAYIDSTNALGEVSLTEVQRSVDLKYIRITDIERSSSTDNSVTTQMLHLLASKPDAVAIGGSGTSVVLPARTLVERGYTDEVYFSHDVSDSDFVRLHNKDYEGVYVSTGPVIVAAELPDINPAKRQALDLARHYETTFGRDSVSIFAAYTGDIGLLLQRAVPVVLRRVKPGIPAFREALHDALKQVYDLPTSTGTANMSPQGYAGLDQHAYVMAQTRRGQWHLADAAK